VRQRLDGGSWKLVGAFTEVESGKRVRRPQLEAALAACKKHRAKLIVAKLDRLARNTRFLLALLDSGVEPVFCDLPEMNGAMGRFMLTSMAAVAELEAGLISERTKAGLAVAKARGTRLGRTGADILAPRWATEARARAEKLAPLVRERGAGCPCARSPPSWRNAKCRRRGAARGTRSSSPAWCGGSKEDPTSANLGLSDEGKSDELLDHSAFIRWCHICGSLAHTPSWTSTRADPVL
jgi:DNA invertase Pin-like site-specific DNA recombinase